MNLLKRLWVSLRGGAAYEELEQTGKWATWQLPDERRAATTPSLRGTCAGSTSTAISRTAISSNALSRIFRSDAETGWLDIGANPLRFADACSILTREMTPTTFNANAFGPAATTVAAAATRGSGPGMGLRPGNVPALAGRRAR